MFSSWWCVKMTRVEVYWDLMSVVDSNTCKFIVGLFSCRSLRTHLITDEPSQFTRYLYQPDVPGPARPFRIRLRIPFRRSVRIHIQLFSIAVQLHHHTEIVGTHEKKYTVCTFELCSFDIHRCLSYVGGAFSAKFFYELIGVHVMCTYFISWMFTICLQHAACVSSHFYACTRHRKGIYLCFYS